MMKSLVDFVVVGGGAAGFFGAICAKTNNPELSVAILEAAPKVLGKVKISGGGRCNVTHACFDPNQLVTFYPRGARELKSVFSRFSPRDTVAWFESHGVKLKTESDGRMFPVTDDAQTIIDCLVKEATRLGIAIYDKTPVSDLVWVNDQFEIQNPGQTIHAKAVLLATGSNRKTFEWLEKLGHTIIAPVPSLFTFEIKHPLLHDLSGIAFPHVVAGLMAPQQKPITQQGPLLITHWGLSGPVVLRLSAWGARVLYDTKYHATCRIDFLPEVSFEAVVERLQQQKTLTPARHMENACPWETLPKRFWQRLLNVCQVEAGTTWANVSKKQIAVLSEWLKRGELPVTGKGPFKEEFVTAGGVSLKDVDFKTMASKHVPGLYLAGEVIDVDGLTGGFNFQNAWSTGWLAGGAAAQQAL